VDDGDGDESGLLVDKRDFGLSVDRGSLGESKSHHD